MIEAYFDGCCEPVNPGGIASYGVVILREGKRIWEASEIFMPTPGREKETSNNVAEYSGFEAILRYLLKENLNQEQIVLFGDSKLVICQMFVTAEYGKRWKIKSGHYVPVARRCQQLLLKFPRLTGKWIPREENSVADELSKAQLKKAGVRFRIQPEG